MSSSFPARLRYLRRLRRREASEWRIPLSQNTMRSQNAARRTRPLPFPSGESDLASASSSPRRLGNVGSGTIVPAPEERADDGAQVPQEIPTFSPSREEGNSRFQAPPRQGRAGSKGGDLGSGPSDRGQQAVGPKARISPHNLTFGTRHCQVSAT